MRSRPSEPRTAPCGLAAAAAALLAAALLASPAAGQGPPPAEIRLDGPYGLWVHEDADTVVVRWITDTEREGRLEVRADGSDAARVRTAAARAHDVRFPLPRGADRLLLRYGARGERLHETRVRLPLDPPRAGAVFEAPDSVYVVGDVHGHFDDLRALLVHVGLVDEAGGWTGGGAHLVFLGDVVDRGWDVTRTLWWIYELEARARRAGGTVHVVAGNHEVMVWTNDLRYVQGKELEVARLHGLPYWALLDPRTSVLGRWLASKPPVLALGDLLLAHGGVSPAYDAWSVEAFDDSLAAWVEEPLFHHLADTTVAVPPMDSAAVARRLDFFFGSENPFWYRGWFPPDAYEAGPAAGGEGADTDSAAAIAGAQAADSVAARLDAVLRRYGASRHVVAHTPLDRVTALYGGRILATDLRRPATELLLLVRQDDGWRPYRWPVGGEPEPME